MRTIGLVGATNVGKSTLFNRLIRQFRAIVTDIPGTTTDIIKHETNFEGIGEVMFSDSPGLLEFSQERPIIQQIINDSDLILFMMDDSVGITAKERQIFEYINKSGKRDHTILVVNKLDINYKVAETQEAILPYYEFGISEVVGISAKKGRYMELLQDMIVRFFEKNFPKKKGVKDPAIAEIPSDSEAEESEMEGYPSLSKECEEQPPQLSLSEGGSQGVPLPKVDNIPIAILGKPNSGKSTLLNTFVGEQLAKVAETAGTTRDYITGGFEHKKQKYKLYDTAGVRKKGKIHGIERIAYEKIKSMLEHIRPVIVFMVDVEQGTTHRDFTLMAETERLGLPIILALNKMDLLSTKQQKAVKKTIQSSLDIARHIPIVPITATTGEGQDDLMRMVNGVYAESRKRIDTNALNKAVSTERISRPPRFPKNKVCKIFYINQVDIDAPTFVVFVNHLNRTNFALRRWLENSIRKHFGFVGVPLILKFKQREKMAK